MVTVSCSSFGGKIMEKKKASWMVDGAPVWPNLDLCVSVLPTNVCSASVGPNVVS